MSAAATTCSVIVPTRNRPGELGRCLEALARQSHPLGAMEVLVVDDGGDAEIRSVVERHRRDLEVRLLRQPWAGPSAARNEGASHAQGELLAFTDDDAVPSPGWVAALVGAYGEAPRDALGGPICALSPSSVFARTTQIAAEAARDAHAADGQPFIAACNLAMPRGAFSSLGGFDPGFDAAEDRELCDRWRDIGRRIRVVPDAIVWHQHPVSLAAFWRTHFHYGRGAFAYHRRRARSGRLASGLRVSGRTARAAVCRTSYRPSSLALIATWQIAGASGAIRGALDAMAG
jgi:GT2 family glycosyltransferase